MNQTHEVRNAPKQAFRAAFAPSSVDMDKRTVDLVWTTGARVRRGYWDVFDEELSLDPKHVRMDRLNGGAPLLDSHDSYSGVRGILGVVENARVDGKQGTATVRFSKRADVESVLQDVKDGIITNISVGYRVHKFEKVGTSDDGEKVPVLRAVDWEPTEISLVPVGADAGAGIRQAPTETNQCEILTRGDPPNERSAMELTEQEKAAAATKAAEEKRQAELKAARDEGAKVERERVEAIRKAVGAAKLDPKFGDDLIARDIAITDARAMVLDELTRRSESAPIEGHIPAQVGEMDSEKWVRGVTNALLARTGQLSNIAAVLDDQKKRDARHQNVDLLAAFKGFDPTDNGGEFRGFSLVDLARESLERRGIRIRGLSTEEIVKRSFYARDGGGQQTSSDFSVALENLMYKTLLGQYAQQSDTWRRFCGTDSVQDFRNSNRYRLGSFGVLDSIDEDGEYKSKVIPDAVKQTISTATYGNKIALSRKAIINDDMGAVIASAERFGRMAGLSIEVAVYALLAANSNLGPTVTYNGITAALFDAQFGNIGTGAAISADALVADQVKMGSQKDISNNEYLDLRPNVLLVPLSLEATAKQINRAAFDPTAGAAFEAPNKAAGLFRDIVGTPRLTGTRRYMFSDQTPALLVVFLNGVQVPVMDQRPGWDIDGIEWKLRIDFNAQGFDPKGAETNAGV